MEILLINPPIRLDEFPPNLPVGVAQVAASLRLDGHDVSIVDVKGCRYTDQDVVKRIQESRADAIGIGGLITTWNYQKWLVETIRSIKGSIPIIAGGGLVTSLPELVFREMDIDYAVLSEGEMTARGLFRSIECGDDTENLAGICFRDKNGHFSQNPPAPLVGDLDDLPFPAWDLLPMDVYTMNGVMDVVSSRGCPMNCTFCYHLFGRGRYRFRSAQNLLAEITEIRRLWPDVSHIHFLDDNMMASKDRLFEFCRLVLDTGLTWDVHGRVSSVDEETLERMKSGGCTRIGFGIESGSQKILDQMRKGVSVERALQAVRLAHRMGIRTHETYIFGYPLENRETVNETISFSKKILKPITAAFFATPYPGTALFEEAMKAGRIPKQEDLSHFVSRLGDATDLLVNLTGYDDATLKQWKDEAQDVTGKFARSIYARYLRMLRGLDGREVFRLVIRKIRRLLRGSGDRTS